MSTPSSTPPSTYVPQHSSMTLAAQSFVCAAFMSVKDGQGGGGVGGGDGDDGGDAGDAGGGGGGDGRGEARRYPLPLPPRCDSSPASVPMSVPMNVPKPTHAPTRTESRKVRI